MSYPGPAADAGGAGSVAPFGSRLLAFVIDGGLSVLIAILAGYRPGHRGYGIVVYGAFLAIELLFVSVAGQTPGMRLLGLRLAHPHPERRLAVWRAVVRTALLMLFVPALVVDADGRGLHDRLTDTAVVRDR